LELLPVSRAPGDFPERRLVSGINDAPATGILRELRSRDPHAAWASFLELYSPVILEVIRLFERDEDAIGDCYLFVCEHLSQNRFRRLLRFRADGPVSFSTWLRAVARNLCLDWHRREFGRHRVFESITRLPTLDQDIFRSVFVECLPPEEASLKLQPRVPGLTVDRLAEGIGRVQLALTPRQRWLLSVRRARAAHDLAGMAQQEDESLQNIPSVALNPESWAGLQEARGVLARGLARLSPRERLLIRLRFERDLTLEEIANLLGLGNPQSADRRIKEAVEKLRNKMT
jgi:RNA polymerase sigma factor (sigma-70 family)